MALADPSNGSKRMARARMSSAASAARDCAQLSYTS